VRFQFAVFQLWYRIRSLTNVIKEITFLQLFLIMTIRTILLILLSGTILAMFALRYQGQTLITATAPYGIISLEFSHNVQHTISIAEAWSGALRSAFYTNMVLDFFFILFYGFFFYLSCRYIGLLFPSRKKVAEFFAKASIAAMILDTLENLQMINSIANHPYTITSFLTAVFAAIKFIIVVVVLSFILFNAIVYFFRNVQQPGV